MCKDNTAAKKKVLSMLGLAARSRNVASGGFATENAVKAGKAYLGIVSGDGNAWTFHRKTGQNFPGGLK